MTEQQAEQQEADTGTESADTDDTPPEILTEAKESGWVPKDRWHGDPEQWKPAKEWVEKGRELAPYLSRQVSKLKEEIAGLKSEHAAEIGRIGKMNEKALQRQRDQIVADFAKQKREAVRLGDEKSYEAAEKAERTTLKNFDDEAAKASEKPKANGSINLTDAEQAAVQTFWNSNQQILNDPMLRGAADKFWNQVSGEMSDEPIKERLAEVRRRVVERFPDEFPGEQRKTNGAARVEGGGSRDGGVSDSGSAWNKLSKDVREAATYQIETERLFDPPGAKKGEKLTPAQLKEARENYAQIYNQD